MIANKGDKAKPEYRARLVAKEIKKDIRDDLFAAMPPLEAKKVLFSLSQSLPGNSQGAYELFFIDIKRAYFHAKAIRDVYAELPEQDSAPGMWAHLLKSTYGIRDAAQNWERECTCTFTGLGFLPGPATP